MSAFSQFAAQSRAGQKESWCGEGDHADPTAINPGFDGVVLDRSELERRFGAPSPATVHQLPPNQRLTELAETIRSVGIGGYVRKETADEFDRLAQGRVFESLPYNGEAGRLSELIGYEYDETYNRLSRMCDAICREAIII